MITNTSGDDKPGRNGWYAYRWDCKDGDIEYHAHGPKESFVVFEGVNAKKDCEIFINAVKGMMT